MMTFSSKLIIKMMSSSFNLHKQDKMFHSLNIIKTYHNLISWFHNQHKILNTINYWGRMIKVSRLSHYDFKKRKNIRMISWIKEIHFKKNKKFWNLQLKTLQIKMKLWKLHSRRKIFFNHFFKIYCQKMENSKLYHNNFKFSTLKPTKNYW